MDPVVAAGVVAAIAGVLTGFAAGLAFRFSEHERAATPLPEPILPAGVGQVLSILRSSAVVLDENDAVVKASAAAHALGLVSGDRLNVGTLLRLARQVRRDGEIREAELDIPRGRLGDQRIRVSSRVAPLGARLVLVLVEDRTEARKIEAVRRDFIANVSHELKTPVGALALLAEAIQSASEDPEAVRRFADRMATESSRITKIVQELIDLSRLQAPDPDRAAAAVLVDDVVQAAAERTKAIAVVKDIEIAIGGEHGLKVLGDETQLVTALGNLVENAVNYSPEQTRVAIGVGRSADLVEISVTDQGIGIPERDRDRIFERFYRVDPARSRETGGTGLGLSIVKHVVQNHGGEIRVWSVEGSGSTFTIRLPLLTDTGGGAPGVGSSGQQNVSPSPLKRIRPTQEDLR
ncbi:MAG TPA: ATP-binding protein [Actinomycetes bacterium]|nr:ATP-binding protein [Actinomycetes bacterium]